MDDPEHAVREYFEGGFVICTQDRPFFEAGPYTTEQIEKYRSVPPGRVDARLVEFR